MPRNARTIRTAIFAVTTAGLAACSSTTSGSPHAAPASRSAPAVPPSSSAPALSVPPKASDVDPCSLVTKAEADKISGVTLQAPSRVEQTCTFASPTSGSPGQLEVYVGDGAKKFYDIDRVDLGHKFQTVPNVADEAHVEDGAIFFRSGGIWIGLRLLRLDEVDTRPLLGQLARIAVGRI